MRKRYGDASLRRMRADQSPNRLVHLHLRNVIVSGDVRGFFPTLKARCDDLEGYTRALDDWPSKRHRWIDHDEATIRVEVEPTRSAIVAVFDLLEVLVEHFARRELPLLGGVDEGSIGGRRKARHRRCETHVTPADVGSPAFVR